MDVSDEVIKILGEKQNIQNEDILMVCDGTYLIGKLFFGSNVDFSDDDYFFFLMFFFVDIS